MDWQLILLLFVGSLILIMFTGFPIAFSFMLVSGAAMFIMFGEAGIRQWVLGVQSQLSNFNFTPIPLFIIMGEVFLQSGIIRRVLDTLSKLVRRVPGRLSAITLLGGGIFAALSGSSLANIVMFGSLTLPEMQRRGYCMKLTTGTVMASGSLAMVIPPSNLAVLMGGISGISVPAILLGAIVPGILLFIFFLGYVVISCIRKPELAPPAEDDDALDYLTPVQKLVEFAKNILPLIFIIVMIMGTIFLGIGTTTEAAAIGALASYILVIIYGKFTFKLLVKTLVGSLRNSVMLLCIIAASGGFSQVLSLTGASRAAVLAVTSVITSATTMLIVMLIITFIVDSFVSESATMMICLPLFMPLVRAFEINEVWFAIMFLIMVQLGQFTPPVGMALFAMKGVAPPDVSLPTIFRGGIPFVFLIFLVVVLIFFFPPLVTFVAGV